VDTRKARDTANKVDILHNLHINHHTMALQPILRTDNKDILLHNNLIARILLSKLEAIRPLPMEVNSMVDTHPSNSNKVVIPHKARTTRSTTATPLLIRLNTNKGKDTAHPVKLHTANKVQVQSDPMVSR